MNHNILIEEVSNKYGYNEELKIAIGLTIPLMVKEYGIDKLDDIYNLFRNTKIIATSDISKEHREAIEKEMIGVANSHIIDKNDDNPYQSDKDPGSYYSYQAIYDENMNVAGEVRWLVVKDMGSSYNGEDYKNMFGTTVNMPYFIHEMGHAFAMQNPTYRKEGNKIYTKHGMYEEVISFEQKDDKVEIDSDSLNSVILEEAINEKQTQDMLVELMGVDDYKEVQEKLDSINHNTTSYGSTIIALAEKFEKVIGKDNLLKLRRDNDTSIIKEFNEIASNSEIGKKYCNGNDFYSILDQKTYGLFLLKQNCYKMPIEEYTRKAKELMLEGYAPLCAYQEVKYGTINLDVFEEVRNNMLGLSVNIEEKKRMIINHDN